MSKLSKPAGLAEFSFLPDLIPDPMEPATPVGAEKHRLRMRQRLLKAGPEALADHEMLEMILFIALPRRDTKPIARALLARFRTFSAVIGAPPAALTAIDGIGEAGAAALKIVQAAALRMMLQDVSTQPVLASWDKLMAYLTASMEHERTEQFRILFLNNKNRLLADEVQGRGTIDRAPAYPREVVRRCLELNATSVILAHNHPSGDPAPSREDIALTAEIARATATMGITLHDHIIVGKGRYLSFRAEKMI
jgi:DNA repair protein RadC